MKSGCLLIDWIENRSARLHRCHRRRLFVLFSPCAPSVLCAENAHTLMLSAMEGKREIFVKCVQRDVEMEKLLLENGIWAYLCAPVPSGAPLSLE